MPLSAAHANDSLAAELVRDVDRLGREWDKASIPELPVVVISEAENVLFRQYDGKIAAAGNLQNLLVEELVCDFRGLELVQLISGAELALIVEPERPELLGLIGVEDCSVLAEAGVARQQVIQIGGLVLLREKLDLLVGLSFRLIK